MLARGTLHLGWIAAAIISLAAFAQRAEARDHGRVAIGINLGGPSYRAPAVEQRYVPGHYETRYETVLVEPASEQRRWAPDLRETRYDRYGRPYTVVVRGGYWERVCVPARYETRAVSVWVPGYYQACAVPVYERPRPRFNLGAFFGF